MPANRFLHPNLGHSEKVNTLTDLEARVWTQYLLSADDYGVMRLSAVNVQADNDSLHTRPTRTIQRCLERIVEVGLVVEFQHQGQRFICQLDWHKYQHVKFPSKTINPCPPAETLDRCDEGTSALFIDHHPMLMRINGASRLNGDVASEAHQVTLKAKGSRLLSSTGLRELFAEFWTHYPRKVGKDVAWKAYQKVNPDSELHKTMLAVLAWQRQQDSWIRDGGQYIPHPSTWLNQGRWKDEQPGQSHVADSTLKTARAVEEFLRD